MKTTRKRSPREDHIVHVARKEILTRSFAGTRTLDIARAAGVSEATVIRTVGNKPQLLQAGHADLWNNHLWPAISAKARGYKDPADQVAEIADTLWSLYEDRSFRDDLMFAIMHCVAADLFISRDISFAPDGNAKYIALIDRLAERAVRSRQVIPGMTKEFLREAILGTIESVLIGWYAADRSSEPQTKVSKVEALSGLRALLSARRRITKTWLLTGNDDGLQMSLTFD